MNTLNEVCSFVYGMCTHQLVGVLVLITMRDKFNVQLSAIISATKQNNGYITKEGQQN
jgi:hypothetical protein